MPAFSVADTPTGTKPDCEVSPHNRLHDGLAVFDHDVEVNFAVLVLFTQLGLGGPDRFGEAFVGDVGLFGLLLGLLKARVQVAQARVVDACRARRGGVGGGGGGGRRRGPCGSGFGRGDGCGDPR